MIAVRAGIDNYRRSKEIPGFFDPNTHYLVSTILVSGQLEENVHTAISRRYLAAWYSPQATPIANAMSKSEW